MAERRMFSKTIIDSDVFLDMPLTAQALYFHLAMRADDDGFVNNPKKIQRMTGASTDDLKLLAAKKFVIVFESGVIVIRHWKLHNYIQNDRYKQTIFQDERSRLYLDKNGLYEERQPNGYSLDTECIQAVSKTDTQVRLGKDSIGKGSIGKGRLNIDNININMSSLQEREEEPQSGSSEREKRKNFPSLPKITRHKYGEYKNVLLSNEELEILKNELPDEWEKYIEAVSAYVASTGKHYKNFLATIRNWAKEDTKKHSPAKYTRNAEPGFNDFGDDNGMNDFEMKMLLRRVNEETEAEK